MPQPNYKNRKLLSPINHNTILPDIKIKILVKSHSLKPFCALFYTDALYTRVSPEAKYGLGKTLIA